MSDEKGKAVTTGLGVGAVATLLTSLAGAVSGAPDVVALAREFGFPTALLLFVVLIIVGVCRYVASKVVEPLVTVTTTSIRTVADESRKHTTTLECMRTEAAADRRDAAEDRKTCALRFEELRARLDGRSA